MLPIPFIYTKKTENWTNKIVQDQKYDGLCPEEEISHSKYMESLFIHVIFDIANATNPIYIHQKDGKLNK